MSPLKIAYWFVIPAAALFIFVIRGALDSPGHRCANPEQIFGTVVDIVRAAICNESAEPTVTVSGDGRTVRVLYSLKPWNYSISETRRAFYRHLRTMVPAVFGHFPQYASIDIVGTAEFADLKGNSGEVYAMHAVFTQANSRTINWSSVALEDLPRIADRFWMRPSLAP